MINAAQIYALALIIGIVASYTLAIKRRSGHLSLQNCLKFPGLIRHFRQEIKKNGARAFLSADMISITLLWLLFLWLFLVAPLWTALRGTSSGT